MNTIITYQGRYNRENYKIEVSSDICFTKTELLPGQKVTYGIAGKGIFIGIGAEDYYKGWLFFMSENNIGVWFIGAYDGRLIKSKADLIKIKILGFGF